MVGGTITEENIRAKEAFNKEQIRLEMAKQKLLVNPKNLTPMEVIPRPPPTRPQGPVVIARLPLGTRKTRKPKKGNIMNNTEIEQLISEKTKEAKMVADGKIKKYGFDLTKDGNTKDGNTKDGNIWKKFVRKVIDHVTEMFDSVFDATTLCLWLEDSPTSRSSYIIASSYQIPNILILNIFCDLLLNIGLTGKFIIVSSIDNKPGLTKEQNLFVDIAVRFMETVIIPLNNGHLHVSTFISDRLRNGEIFVTTKKKKITVKKITVKKILT